MSEKKILIAYSKTENVEHSFWKYFFQSCGIWVKSCNLANDPHVLEAQYQTIYILNYMDLDILSTIYPESIYIVKNNSAFRKYRQYENVCILDWKNINSFMKIVNIIFGQESFFVQLLLHFIRNNLWRDAWLYHEVAHVKNNVWDKNIRQDSRNTIGLLKSMKNKAYEQYDYYKQYMILYCEFLNLGAQRIGTVDWDVKNSGLMKQINELACKYEWTLPLLMLQAKVCSLSSITSMRSVKYLSDIAAKDYSANILYDIGRQYGEIYGNWELANEFYEEAVQCNAKYFRALYQRGKKEEKQGEWIDAIKTYLTVINLLPSKKQDTFASMAEVEYLYKSIQNIKRIATENLNYQLMAEAIQEMLIELQQEQGMRFNKLIHCMETINKDEDTQVIFDKVMDEIHSRVI